MSRSASMTTLPRSVDASVVVPVAGTPRFLPQQVEALVGQVSAPPFEVIFVLNDAPAADWFATYPRPRPGGEPVERFRVVEALDRRTPGHARNAGVLAAEAPLILFCDSDDVVSPTWVGSLVDALQTADLASGPLDVDRLNAPRFAAVRGRRWAEAGATFLDTFPVAPSCNLGVRRSFFLDVGGFDETLRTGQDVDLCFRAWIRGATWEYRDGALVHYRIRADLSTLLEQSYRYGRFGRWMERRVASEVQLERADRAVRRWVWILRKVHHLAISELRPRWIWTLGLALGRLRGTLGTSATAQRPAPPRGRMAGRRKHA